MKKALIALVLTIIVVITGLNILRNSVDYTPKYPEIKSDYVPIHINARMDKLKPFKYSGYMMPYANVRQKDDKGICKRFFFHPENEKETFLNFYKEIEKINKKRDLLNSLQQLNIFNVAKSRENLDNKEKEVYKTIEKHFDSIYLYHNKDLLSKVEDNMPMSLEVIYINALKAFVLNTEPDTSIEQFKYYDLVYKDKYTITGIAYNIKAIATSKNDLITFNFRFPGNSKKVNKNDINKLVYNGRDNRYCTNYNSQKEDQTKQENYERFYDRYTNFPMACEYEARLDDKKARKILNTIDDYQNVLVEITGSFDFKNGINKITDINIK